jgi:hypothetical protein
MLSDVTAPVMTHSLPIQHTGHIGDVWMESIHPFAGVELVPSSKRSVCPLYFNLAPLLIHLVLYVDLV